MNSFYTVTTQDRIDQDARALWIKVYVCALERGKSRMHATKEADDALDSFMVRFGEQPDDAG